MTPASAKSSFYYVAMSALAGGIRMEFNNIALEEWNLESSHEICGDCSFLWRPCLYFFFFETSSKVSRTSADCEDVCVPI